MFSLICAWINGWVNNGEAGDLRRQRAHYDITVMTMAYISDANRSPYNYVYIFFLKLHAKTAYYGNQARSGTIK